MPEHILTTKGTMPKPETLAGASIPEYIEVKTATGNTVAFLSPESDNLKDCWIDDDQNGSCTLEFELPLNSPKWQYLTDQYRIHAGGKEFVILNPDAVDKQRDGQKLKGKVKAHESWVLLGKKYQTICNDPLIGTPPWGAVIIVSGGTAHGGFDAGSAGSALSYLLQDTGWAVGTVDVPGTYDLETEKESVLYNINQVQEKWGGILIWDSVNKTVSLRDEVTYQPYTGYQIRYAKNLKGINRVDDYDIVTRLYPFGENDLNIANVNGGLLYLDNHSYSDDILEGVWYNQDIADQTQLKIAGEKQLAVMCRPRHNYKTEVLDLRSLPGYGHEAFKRSDMVDLFDEDFGANARVRIIRYRHNVFQPWLCDMELGDPLEKIAASVAQTVLMAKFYKNVVAPNTSFQNLLKAIINTEATEINGASGDYTLVDGVSTWFDRDDVTGELTGKLLRITPQGLIISYDGGQTWKLAISGEGIHADAGWVGKLNAGLITVGPDTTFEPGYDPSQAVGMGVDSDCLGLWHFDGSLNSHKGVAVDSDALFGGGCFGQALNIATGKKLKVPTTGMDVSVGTVNFRARNLAESANGAVLVDLPKSDNTQGILAGISSATGHEGEVFITDLPNISKSYTETTQSDFNSGTLTDVVATSAGDLELAPASYNYGSDFTGGKTYSASSEYSATYSADKAFDNNEETRWNGDNAKDFPYWIKVDLGSGITKKARKLRIKAAYFERAGVKDFKLQGSNDNTNWTDIYTGVHENNDNWQEYTFNNANAYRYYRIHITSNHGGAAFASIWEIEMMEALYKTLGTREKIVDLSGANPAGGTKIEWSKTTPTNTTVKVETALSTDGGSTYGAYAEATSGQAIPGITSDTDLSNARLKIKETLSTTDTSVTPKLHSLTFTIWEKQATTVYGPNKSTLTAWDSIALAWKPDRLSLVVNDTEACYIENPGLPTAFGSYLYIGTDRNGANAINTLVDELRIDKVYREVNIRTGWHKTGVPFYTSEDMKQWPGYMKLETDGLKVYDSSDDLRVLVGSWLKGLIRKYGIKIIDGEIYSSIIRSGAEDATEYIQLVPPNSLQVWHNSKVQMNIHADYGARIDFFRDAPDTSPLNAVARITGGYGGADLGIMALGNTDKIAIGGNLDVAGSITKSGGLNYVEPTKDYGIRLLNALEGPELKYVDMGRAQLENGEATVYLDPILLQCIEPDTDLTPWLFKTEVYGEGEDIRVIEWGENYFKVKECNGGTSNRKFGWWFYVTRINYAGIRLQEYVAGVV